MTTTTETSLGERFAAAIAARDRDGLLGLLTDDVDFKGLTPRRLWEADNAADVAEVVFGSWFEEQDRVTELVDLEEGRVADTARVGYRFDVECADGPYVVEQQAYYRVHGGRICYLRMVCSGFRARPAHESN